MYIHIIGSVSLWQLLFLWVLINRKCSTRPLFSSSSTFYSHSAIYHNLFCLLVLCSSNVFFDAMLLLEYVSTFYNGFPFTWLSSKALIKNCQFPVKYMTVFKYFFFMFIATVLPLISSSFSLRCPFLFNLDLIGIANRFAQFNLPAFALGTLLLIPCTNKKAQQIQVSVSMGIQQMRSRIT